MSQALHPLVRQLLQARGLAESEWLNFLQPRYDQSRHDPFLLPDMMKAVERIVKAQQQKHQVVVYGDYDIDGLTATSLLLDAFESFGITARAFIPNRFVEGYGLAQEAVEKIIEEGAELIVTVDCGSLSHQQITRANELGCDVVVTDHHNVAAVMPPAVAVVNPKRSDHTYPFIDLAGVGVAFKLVQALQTRLDGLKPGQEKWLLDLVALGTVCDVVSLQGENRANVYWGLEVLKKTRRPGLLALMAVSGVTSSTLDARSLGFGLGPRMNAAGRLETALYSLELLTTQDNARALELAEKLDRMNIERRAEQERIFQEAVAIAETLRDDSVLVVSGRNWSHGIIGIVAAKLLEKYKKPTYVLEEMEELAKGSARSFGDFSAADAIRATEHLITQGGGHKLAAGITLPVKNIAAWRTAVNAYYHELQLVEQEKHLWARADLEVEHMRELNEELVRHLAQLEPYGKGNEAPIFSARQLKVLDRRVMGAQKQHVKFILSDRQGGRMAMVAFNAAHEFTHEIGETVRAWFEVMINEWQGRRSVEGRLVRLEDDSFS